MRKTLLALAVAAGLVGIGTTAQASTTTPKPPVVCKIDPVTHGCQSTVKGGTPVIKVPRHTLKHHRHAAIQRFSARAIPPVITYAVKANLWQHTAANSLTSTRIQIIPGGSSIRLDCYTVAESVNGDSVWYSTNWDGHQGYVAGYYVLTGHDPVSGLGHC